MRLAPQKSFAKTLYAGVYLYRHCLSPLQYSLRVCFGIACECRFSPTCSEYAMQCLQKHPLGLALKLIVKRLLRCHPGRPGGYDPVP